MLCRSCHVLVGHRHETRHVLSEQTTLFVPHARDLRPNSPLSSDVCAAALLTFEIKAMGRIRIERFDARKHLAQHRRQKRTESQIADAWGDQKFGNVIVL